MPEPDTVASERIEFLRKLRSIRQFTSRPIPRNVLDDILTVARWSGSGSNEQPWELVLVQKRETLEELGSVEGYVAHLRGAAAGIVLVMDGKEAEIETYDEGRLSERIMLAAFAHDVGSCIGWPVGVGLAQVKSILGIPEGRLVRTLISLGYPDVEAQKAKPRAAQPRKPLEQIVHEEKF